MQEIKQEERKKDHIDLARSAQTDRSLVDPRFNYEPLLSSHPIFDNYESNDLALNFLGKTLRSPLWISSMTGGVGEARHINQNLAHACREFGLGMGLGSCRVLLEDRKYFSDFNLRPILGHSLPFYANLGIAQIERLLLKNELNKLNDLLSDLDVDGLIVHINPLQEWLQPEGDRLMNPPLETLKNFCSVFNKKMIIKEVGQGMGPKSLKALLELPIDAIELAAFGGTNFSKLELLRRHKHSSWSEAMTRVGHTAEDMIETLNEYYDLNPAYKNKQLIISGGIESIIDGYYLLKKSKYNSVIGQAKNFLIHANNYEDLKYFIEGEITGLRMAEAFLALKNQGQN